MSYEEAIKVLPEDEAFRATVYAMNTLLIQKGVYGAREFEYFFCQHAENFKNGFRGRSQKAAGISREAVATTS